MANAVKYANASAVAIRAWSAGPNAVVEIADDGVGGADPAGGSGLRGLADRVEALGGQLSVSSPRGGGTVIAATIPLRQV
jgi:signal transduction histidine kinase